MKSFVVDTLKSRSLFGRKTALPVSALLIAIAAAAMPAREVASQVRADSYTQTPVERLAANLLEQDILEVNGAVETEILEKPSVRAVYLVPADKEINPEYALGLENAMKDIQKWFHDQLGGDNSFQLHSSNVITVQSSHNADWFINNPADTSTPLTRFISNVSTDAAALLPEFYDGDKFVIVVDADSGTDQFGAAAALDIAAILDADYLRGLAGEFTPGEGQAANTVFGNVGVVAHELAHVLGLDHPDQPCTTDPCDLMAYPRNYPLVVLDQNEINTINDSFFLDFRYIEVIPEFQVEVRMFNLADNREQFSLNGSAFMNMNFSMDTGRLDISNWLQPGKNIIDLFAIGSSSAYTYGFEIFIDDALAYEETCGEPGVTNCDGGSPFSGTYSFVVPITTATPTQIATFTPTETPIPVNTPTHIPERTATPTEQRAQANGDVNCDGSVDPVDAALILQQTAGLINEMGCEFNGDVSRDGAISPIDAALILQFAAGIIDGFNNQTD